MRCGELQSAQTPVEAQGVESLRRRGVPRGRRRLDPPDPLRDVRHDLVRPRDHHDLLGPNVIAFVRLPFPSRLTRHPSSVTALVPDRNRSQASWARRVAAFSSGGTRPWSSSRLPFPFQGVPDPHLRDGHRAAEPDGHGLFALRQDPGADGFPVRQEQGVEAVFPQRFHAPPSQLLQVPRSDLRLSKGPFPSGRSPSGLQPSRRADVPPHAPDRSL